MHLVSFEKHITVIQKSSGMKAGRVLLAPRPVSDDPV
jgi:hypothetical protein